MGLSKAERSKAAKKAAATRKKNAEAEKVAEAKDANDVGNPGHPKNPPTQERPDHIAGTANQRGEEDRIKASDPQATHESVQGLERRPEPMPRRANGERQHGVPQKVVDKVERVADGEDQDEVYAGRL